MKFKLLVFLILFFNFQFSQAQQQELPPPPPVVVINPDSLRSMVLTQNYQVIRELNRVYQAKTKVNIARAALLPKLNLSGLFTGAGFALSAIQFLMPFLNPGNWLELKASKELLQAQGQSFYISELNTYASAQALYATYVSDLSVRDALRFKYENARTLSQIVKDQFNLGLVGELDFRQAEAQAQMAELQLSQIEELLVQEKSSLREMLALPLETVMNVEQVHVAPSVHEFETPAALLPTALAKSPEINQLNFLISASKNTKWKVFFSFISGATYSSSGNPANFGSLKPGGLLTFDFGTFPALQMSELNIELYEIQKKELGSMHAQILETTLGGLQEARRQLDLASLAAVNQQVVYQALLNQYHLGQSELLPVLIASNDYLAAEMAQVRAQANLDNLRIQLNRIVLEDQFLKIQDCKIAEKVSKHKKQMTIEEACK